MEVLMEASMHKWVRKFSLTFLVLLCIACFKSELQARNPYHATVTVGPFSAVFSESTILNLIQDLQTDSIQREIAIYDSNSPASFNLNLRGLVGIASYAANSTTLTVQIPQTGTSQSFTGATREDSAKLFDEFLKNDRPFNKKFRKAYAKFTPIDPIAGNPNSLMAQMAQADYLIGRLSPLSGCDCCWSAQPITHQFQAGLYSGRGFSDGFDTTIVTIPLRYSYSPNRTWALVLDAPQNYVVNGRAVSIDGSLGLGLRVPITNNWSITPITRGGVGISIDLSTGGIFASTGVTSAIDYKICKYVITMTNYAGYCVSTPCHAGGINFDYHLQNFVFKNGLALNSCEGFDFCGRPLNFNLTFIDSAFTGSSLFIDHYDEVGAFLIMTRVNPCIKYDCLSLGATYQFGKRGYKGYSLNLTYQF